MDPIKTTARIVCAHVSSNSVPAGDLPGLIRQTHATLVRLAAPSADAEAGPLTPAVPVKRSVTPDHIVCLEDGRRLKSLKRHLRARYDLTPEQYRAKWGLPVDYPMVAPNYAAARSQLAKNMGLGQMRRAA